MATILVLDDMQDVAIMIRKILETSGHVVSAFTEANQALAYAGSHPVDLAILDVKLNRTSGIKVLEELKRIRPNMHVMMLTAYPSLESATEGLRLGVEEYCMKPIEIDDLEEKVASILKIPPHNEAPLVTSSQSLSKKAFSGISNEA